MNREVMIYENKEFGQVRTMMIDGEVWFVGKDVAEILGYKNGSRDINRHVDAEDRTTKTILHYQTGTSGQNREIIVINESGLYSLILSSKLPKAKRFKRWVTSEVLPSIRKHGGYIQHQEKLSEEEIFANAVLLANKLIAEKSKEVERLKPKAEYYDKLVDQHLLTNFRNTAKELHLTQKRFIQFLMEHQFIYRDKKNRLLPYAKKNKGYFEIKEWVREEGQVVGIQTLITPKGREFFLFLVGGGGQFD